MMPMPKLSCLPVSFYPAFAAGKISILDWADIARNTGLDAIDLSVLMTRRLDLGALKAAASQQAAQGELVLKGLADLAETAKAGAAPRSGLPAPARMVEFVLPTMPSVEDRVLAPQPDVKLAPVEQEPPKPEEKRAADPLRVSRCAQSRVCLYTFFISPWTRSKNFICGSLASPISFCAAESQKQPVPESTP